MTENKHVCSVCRSLTTTRPYGKQGAEVCFVDAMRDQMETARQTFMVHIGRPMGIPLPDDNSIRDALNRTNAGLALKAAEAQRDGVMFKPGW